jgi:catecholate siderophore receptor
MTKIRSRKHSVNRYLATVAAVALPAMPLIAHAQAAEEKTLKEVTVTATVDKYKREVTNPKNTQPLLDTPQTISVIGRELIEEQGAVSLVEALRNTPGITLQMGENGNSSTGDTFQMRGFSMQNSLYQDGIRDVGAITRDTFNVEQIEIAKGPAGSDAGRGASAGFINTVTKLPQLATLYSGTAAVTTEEGYRLTADGNVQLSDTIAFRLNAMVQDLPAVDRDQVENTGHGIAPSIAFGLGTKSRFYVFAQHVKADNVPDGGIPAIGYEGFVYVAPATNPPSSAVVDAANAAPRVSNSNYYGSRNDFEKTEANMLTGKFEYDLGENTFLTSIVRYGKNSQRRDQTGTIGISYGPTTTTSTWNTNRDTWTVARSRQGTNNENEVFVAQTNLTTSFMTGSIQHDLAAGIELSKEDFRTDTLRVVTGTSTTAANLYNPSVNDTFAPLEHSGAFSEGETTTAALYAFDTIKFNDQWMVNLSARVESYDIEANGAVRSTATSHPTLPVDTLVVSPEISGDGTLFSWKIGGVYKPVPNASIYAAVANSKTPPGSLNGQLNAGATNINNPNLDPQETLNYEIGTKWDLFEARLGLTAALYRSENENEIVVDLDPGTGVIADQIGKRVVEGIELSAVGKITDKWSITAGIQTMNTEYEEGSGTGTTANGAGVRWSPELTGTVWTTYADLIPGLTIGGGARYTSEQIRSTTPGTNFAVTTLPEIPAYWVWDGMASYDLTDKVTLQLNVYNLFDEDYLSTLNNGGSRIMIGTPRYAKLTASMKF